MTTVEPEPQFETYGDFFMSLVARLIVMAAIGLGTIGLIPPANAICLMVGMAVFQYLFLSGQEKKKG